MLSVPIRRLVIKVNIVLPVLRSQRGDALWLRDTHTRTHMWLLHIAACTCMCTQTYSCISYSCSRLCGAEPSRISCLLLTFCPAKRTVQRNSSTGWWWWWWWRILWADILAKWKCFTSICRRFDLIRLLKLSCTCCSSALLLWCWCRDLDFLQKQHLY